MQMMTFFTFCRENPNMENGAYFCLMNTMRQVRQPTKYHTVHTPLPQVIVDIWPETPEAGPGGPADTEAANGIIKGKSALMNHFPAGADREMQTSVRRMCFVASGATTPHHCCDG
jgi:hypothetical protein